MNEIIQNYIDRNLQNSKNCNFFRLFKMKRKNQNYKDDIFPPLYANSPPVETEQNIKDKNRNDKKEENNENKINKNG